MESRHLPEAFTSSADSPRFPPGKSTASRAETNRESPSNAKPPCRFPVFLFITPRAYGPTKPPRFPIELIKAMPYAAEIPQRNWLGTDQKGPRVLESAMTTTDKRATERDGECVVTSASIAIPAIVAGM